MTDEDVLSGDWKKFEDWIREKIAVTLSGR